MAVEIAGGGRQDFYRHSLSCPSYVTSPSCRCEGVVVKYLFPKTTSGSKGVVAGALPAARGLRPVPPSVALAGEHVRLSRRLPVPPGIRRLPGGIALPAATSPWPNFLALKRITWVERTGRAEAQACSPGTRVRRGVAIGEVDVRVQRLQVERH